MTDCAQALALVEKLSDGEATAAEKRAAESHLEECSSCRSHFEFLVSLAEESRSLSFPEPPESYWEHLPRNVLKRIDSESRSSSRGRMWSVLLAPAMLRFGAVGATVVVLVTVGVAVLRDRSLNPPPSVSSPVPSPAAEEPKSREAPERQAQAIASESVPPPMARDESVPDAPAAPKPSLGSEVREGAAGAIPPAAPAESEAAFESDEVVVQAQEPPALRKENTRALESAYRSRAAAPAAAFSRDVTLETCDELRRAVAATGDGPDRNDFRYRLALCSLQKHQREATEELRAVAIEDAEAFLASEGEGPRAEEIRAKLERIRPD